MLKIALLCVSLGFILYPSQSTSQPLQIDERFGVQVHFPEGWSLLSQDLYAPGVQGQIFASANEGVSVIVEKPLMLSEVNKQEWARGGAGHSLLYADRVDPVNSEDWPFDSPEFLPDLFSKYPNGMSVFFADASNWLGYVIFISRGGIFVKINITASKGDVEPDLAELQAILATLTIKSTLPEESQDPYTLAEKMYLYDRDYEQAIFFYEQVPKEHPKYSDAQRTIGYRILGKQFDDWSSAVPYVEEAYKIAPDDPKVLEDIGRVYLKMDRIEEGIGLLEKAGTRTALEALEKVRQDDTH